MTLKVESEKWGLILRRINYYCAGNRISDIVKMVTIRLIPKVSEKPVDRCRKKSGDEYDKNCDM